MPDPNLCSHDAPGQKPGTKCIRCGKMLEGAPKEAAPVEEEEELEKEDKYRS